MLRQVVSSEIILSVGYDSSESVLEVEFRNRWVYRYEGVPAAVYQALMAAQSHGKYLKRHVVDQFMTTRIR